jgi:hypothetical protein
MKQINSMNDSMYNAYFLGHINALNAIKNRKNAKM